MMVRSIAKLHLQSNSVHIYNILNVLEAFEWLSK